MSLRLAKVLLHGVSVAAISNVLTTAGFAQQARSPSDDSIELSAVVVTGEKVARSLDDTATSVTVLTARDISERFGDNTVHDMIAGVPNVYFAGPVGAPIIRGQDTQGPNIGSIAFLSGTVPRATINMDGHYQNYYEYVFGATSTWDVQSIEVFRGPQTTSQGANAIAGTIIVNTKDPTFTPEAAYQMEYGSYDTQRVSAMVSGAVNNQLAARLAVDYYARDTFIDYVSPKFAAGQSDQDYASLVARFKLLWKPDAIPGFEAKLTFSHNETNRPTDEAAFAPYGNLESISLSMPNWNQTTNTGILDVNYDFGNGFKFVNQAQYSDSSVARINEPMSNASADIQQTNISNEARLLFGNAENPLSGFAGVYYANTSSDEVLYFRGTSSFDDTKDNLGIFSEASYKLTERWTVTGSLRYENDRVQRMGTSTQATAPLDYDQSFEAWLPKLTLAYKLTPDVTVGALVSRGYNPGGVSLNVNTGKWLTFEQEMVWDYELFARAHLLDGKMFLTGNLFYMDYQNAQRYVGVLLTTGVTQSYTVNAEHANAYGFELSAEYKILDNLRVNAGWGVVSTEITQMAASASYVGNEFQKSPGFTFDAGFIWTALPNFNISGTVRCVDGYYSDDANALAYAVSSYVLADARMSYKFNQHAEVYGYAKNLLDERTPTFMQANRSLGGIEASMTIPRILGVGLRGTF